MLIPAKKEHAKLLHHNLTALSAQDMIFFHPHNYDVVTIERCLANDRYYLFQIDSGEIAGYGMLRTFGEYAIPSLGCVIWPQYRGQCLGQQLVQELIDEAIRLDCSSILLTVKMDNKIAIAIYQKAGFEIVKSNVEDSYFTMEKVVK